MIKKIYGCAYAKLCVFYNNVRSTSNGEAIETQKRLRHRTPQPNPLNLEL